MPVITRYCDKCGVKIPPEDFEDNKAISYLYLAYCQKCRGDVDKIIQATKEYEDFEGGPSDKKASPARTALVLAVMIILAAGAFFIGSSTSSPKGAVSMEDFEALKNSNLQLQNESSILKKEISTLKEDYTSLQDRNRALNEKSIELERKLDEAGNPEKLLEEINTLKDQITELRKKNGSFLAEKDKLLADKERLMKESGALKSQIETLKEKTREVEEMEKRVKLLQVGRTLSDWVTAYNTGDHNAVLDCYSNESAYVKSFKENKEKVLEAFEQATKNYRYQASLDVQTAQILDEAVIVDVDLTVVGEEGNKFNQSQRRTFVKESGKWVILKEENR